MADRRRIAAALEYLGAMRDRAAEFGSGVAGTLANRARDVGGLAYEALTSDPNIGRMNTAEFAQAAASRAPTPRLDAAGQGAVELGRAVLTQPVQTGKALARDQVNAFMGAFDGPRAMGEYAGSMVNPLRLASALRRPPMQELDVYHGTPHRFPATEANPLGEFDASKVGTGEGEQAYGHGIYLAESPKVAKSYQALDPAVSAPPRRAFRGAELNPGSPEYHAARIVDEVGLNRARKQVQSWIETADPRMTREVEGWKKTLQLLNDATDKKDFKTLPNKGNLYTLDLPDEMIDRMLDWDKPLSEQPEAVRRVLMPMVMAKMKERGTPPHALEYSANRALGGDIVKNLFVGNGVTSKDVSRMLQEAGIPGVRYLDAGSRGGDSATGTRNFVVFPGEEKKVKVLRRE
jgi:hypothetical protein